MSRPPLPTTLLTGVRPNGQKRLRSILRCSYCLLCLLCLGLPNTAEVTAQLTAADDVSATRFALPAIDTGQWYDNRDFLGRSLVVVHFASTSSAAQRMLPLWKEQLQQAAATGQIHVLAIAHEQHPGRAALLAEELAWPWLVLHEPLLESLHPQGDTDFPWATVFDGNGNLVSARMTLAEVSAKVLVPGAKLQSAREDSKHSPAGDSPSQALGPTEWFAQFQARQQAGATIEELRPMADRLLRLAFHSSPAQAAQILPPIRSFYHQALHSTQDGQWAFRLAVTYRLGFDLSIAVQQIDAELWQHSLDYLELANQSASATAAWRAWLEQYQPVIDRSRAPNLWVSEQWLRISNQRYASKLEPWTLGLPVFHWESPSPIPVEAPLPEERESWPRATRVPPASIRIQSVWVNGESSETNGRWARLFLHVHLKRGDWHLAAEPRLKWVPPGSGSASSPIDLTPQVQSAILLNSSEPRESDPESTAAVWLATDVWLPADLPAERAVDSTLPPRRNAQLIFQGHDPLTGELEWREAEFYMPVPDRSRLDW